MDAWLRIHSRLVELQHSRSQDKIVLEAELNNRVADLLQLDQAERWLVRDLVHVRMHLNKGKIAGEAIRSPSRQELEQFGDALRICLNGFLDEELKLSHRVTIVHDGRSGMVQIDLVENEPSEKALHVLRADVPTAYQFQQTRARLEQEQGQWLYFDRNLFLYRGEQTFILKPMQRLWWTCSQGLLDADEIIAASLAPQGTG